MKEIIYKALEKPQAWKYGYFVQFLLLIIIITNIISTFLPDFINLESVTLKKLKLIETITIYLFIVELILRFYSIGINEKYSGIKGRIKYTFEIYTIIDILAILSYFLPSNIIFIRVLKLARIFKLWRMKKFIKKMFSIYMFANSHIIVQAIILLIISTFIIFIFKFAYNNIELSFLLFLDPSNLIKLNSFQQEVFGVTELIIGLIFGGMLISIITDSLSQLTTKIKEGYYPYKDSDHIIIININKKIRFILNELSNYCKYNEQNLEIVFFVPECNNLEQYRENIPPYPYLYFTYITGENYSWTSYDRLNINKAQALIYLDTNSEFTCEKTIKYITSNEKFKNKKINFIIEKNNTFTFNKIFNQIIPHNQFTLIKSKFIIERLLNRAIINANYFKIFTELLTYENYIFSFMKNKKFKTFEEAYMQIQNAIIIGIKRKGKIILNPNKNLKLTQDDTLVLIKKIDEDIKIETVIKKELKIHIPIPKTKEDKKICVIGNYTDLDLEKIKEFLTKDSFNNIKFYIEEDNKKYFDKNFWNEIKNIDFDYIIINLEDDLEFILMQFLYADHNENKEFLSKIVNIIHDPIDAKLIGEHENIILSQELVGKYIGQIYINSDIHEIFNELTMAEGNEFYILNNEEYKKLKNLDKNELKQALINNNMLYIGYIDINNNFILNGENINNSKNIVVISEGI
ncbi:CASTOR/POLLUX-related putative ion channel [Caminibacter sp.]